MPTFEEVRESIYQRWRAGWTATVDSTFAGEPFDEPRKRNWARLTVRNQVTPSHTLGPIGSRKFTRIGAIFVNLYVPIDSGEGALDPLMKAANDLFEGVSFEGIRSFASDARETGQERGIWNTAIVEVPFDFHETK